MERPITFSIKVVNINQRHEKESMHGFCSSLQLEMRPKWVPDEARISPKWGQDGRRMRPKWMKNEARMDGEWGPNGLRMRPEWMRNEMEEGSGWIPAWMDWWIESYRGRIGEGLRPDWRGIEAWMTSDRIWYRQFVVGPERWIPDVTALPAATRQTPSDVRRSAAKRRRTTTNVHVERGGIMAKHQVGITSLIVHNNVI